MVGEGPGQSYKSLPYNLQFYLQQKSWAIVTASFLPDGDVLAKNSTGSLSRSHFNEIVTGITVKIRIGTDIITFGIVSGFIEIFKVAKVGVASNMILYKIAKQEMYDVLLIILVVYCW